MPQASHAKMRPADPRICWLFLSLISADAMHYSSNSSFTKFAQKPAGGTKELAGKSVDSFASRIEKLNQ
jgi:hypothetical protein